MEINLAEYFKGGFSIGRGYECVEVVLDDKRTRGNVLAFLCYDANLWALPDISDWNKAYANQILDAVRKRTNAVNAEVWVDDVKLKDYEPEVKD